jgi:tRNA A-37 threonylcarbamoyl transferase component Bud32
MLQGSVLGIKHKFVRGTHSASKVSHFQEVARCITSMHEAGIVHGDIRCFNMLRPHPNSDPVPDRITRSCLIDFDLCGKPGIDQYPPVYASKVDDNVFVRSGKPCQNMETVQDLIAPMRYNPTTEM